MQKFPILEFAPPRPRFQRLTSPMTGSHRVRRTLGSPLSSAELAPSRKRMRLDLLEIFRWCTHMHKLLKAEEHLLVTAGARLQDDDKEDAAFGAVD